MLHGDPQLDRELRAENRKSGRWRRRLFIVVVAMLVAIVGWAILAAVTTPTVVADSSPYEPEAPSWRVEVPDAGLALSLPRHWEVRVRMDEPGVGGHLDDPEKSLWLVLDSKSPYEPDDPRHGGCNVWLFRTAYPDTDAATLDDIWSDPYVYWSDPRYAATRTETEVTLPAGPATRFDFGDPAMYGDMHHADYRFLAPDGVVWLMCKSVGERPADDWLAIAETLEFLPEEE